MIVWFRVWGTSFLATPSCPENRLHKQAESTSTQQSSTLKPNLGFKSLGKTCHVQGLGSRVPNPALRFRVWGLGFQRGLGFQILLVLGFMHLRLSAAERSGLTLLAYAYPESPIPLN